MFSFEGCSGRGSRGIVRDWEWSSTSSTRNVVWGRRIRVRWWMGERSSRERRGKRELRSESDEPRLSLMSRLKAETLALLFVCHRLDPFGWALHHSPISRPDYPHIELDMKGLMGADSTR